MKNSWIEKAKSCKIGTVPHMVQVHGASVIKVGMSIRFKEQERGKWMTGIVREVHPDGFFKADRM